MANMRKVIFSLQKKTGSNLLIYPDKTSHFSNIDIVDGQVVADYKGQLPLADYVEPEPAPTLLVDIAKINSNGNGNDTDKMLLALVQSHPNIVVGQS